MRRSRLPLGSGAIPFREIRSKRFCAEDRGFLSEAVQSPFGNQIQTFLCGGSRLPLGSGAIPYREIPIQTFLCGGSRLPLGSRAIPFGKSDPNVSVRRIEASSRKRYNSLSGNQIQTFLCGGSRLPLGSGTIPFREIRSKRFCAEDRGFLSEAGQFPFREIRSKRFCAEDRGFLSEAGQLPFGKSDPNVSVRRIEASSRKRGNSISGNP